MTVLAGREANRKLSIEIRSYIEMRFPIIYQETRYNYSKRIRDEIERVFGKKISGETIRPILKDLKEGIKAKPIEAVVVAGNGENNCDCVEAVCSEYILNGQAETNDGVVENRSELPDFCEEKGVRFCHHLRVLLFSSLLLRVEAFIGEGGWVIKQ